MNDSNDVRNDDTDVVAAVNSNRHPDDRASTSTSTSNDRSNHRSSTDRSSTDLYDGSSSIAEGSLFFADATLDLSMAHDFADTPEAVAKHRPKLYLFNHSQQSQPLPPLPPLTTTTTTTVAAGQQPQQQLPQYPSDPFATINSSSNNPGIPPFPLDCDTADAVATTTSRPPNDNHDQLHHSTIAAIDSLSGGTEHIPSYDSSPTIPQPPQQQQSSSSSPVPFVEPNVAVGVSSSTPDSSTTNHYNNNTMTTTMTTNATTTTRTTTTVVDGDDVVSSVAVLLSVVPPPQALATAVVQPHDNDNKNNNHHNNHQNDNDNPTTSVTRTTTTILHTLQNYTTRTNSSKHTSTNNNNTTIQQRPKYPRDIGWVIAFVLVVPISMFYPILFLDGSSTSTSSTTIHTNSTSSNSSSATTTATATITTNAVLAHHPLSFATLHAITWTILVGIGLIRFLLYRPGGTSSHSGSSSNSARIGTTTTTTTNVAVFLTTVAPFSILMHALITMTVAYICFHVHTATTTTTHTTGYWVIAVPLLGTIREVWIYRYYLSRTIVSTNDIGYMSRIALFHELFAMACHDLLLQRSKLQPSRRSVRIITILFVIQCAIVLVWRTSMLHILSTANTNTLLSVHVLFSIMIGIWCTACITKCITYLVSGAILIWSMEQSERLLELQSQQGYNDYNYSNNNNNGVDMEEKYIDSKNNNCNNNMDADDNGSIVSRQSRNSIPEAYRTVDASVYQSVSFHMDDLHLNDDDDDDDDYYDNNEDEQGGIEIMNQRRRIDQNQPYTYLNGTNHNPRKSPASTNLSTNTANTTITMKSMIRMGLTMNLGSIIYCGFVSDLAQFLYTHFVLYIDFIRQQLQRRSGQYSNNNSTITSSRSNGGFQDMTIGSSSSATGTASSNIQQRIMMALSTIRNFVYFHGSQYDLPMTHVATYYKGFTRATRDVSALIHETGLEPILQEDISVQICTSICTTISGVIVLITTYLLLRQRKNRENSNDITEIHVVETMLLSYIFSYTLLYTAFEPLRASIHASYIAFAQNPQCFLQTYPLIYHRLCRLSATTRTTGTLA